MKIFVAFLMTVSLVVSALPAKALSQNFTIINKPSYNQNDYTLKININGVWYLVTYNSDGYIINIVEDDE